jgi:catechol 2,3-dioxygenase
MAQLGTAAAFMSAGGYHHHIGANTWESAGSSPPPAGTAALRQATIILADETEIERAVARLRRRYSHRVDHREGEICVTDPSGNRLLLTLP